MRPFRMDCTWLTGHSEGDLLHPAPGLVLGHTGVGAWISPLCRTEDKIQPVLVHSALSGDLLTSSLPPHLRLRSAPRGTTGNSLHGVRFKNVRHPGHHFFYLCSEQRREPENFQCEVGIWKLKLVSIYTRSLMIIKLSSKPVKH